MLTPAALSLPILIALVASRPSVDPRSLMLTLVTPLYLPVCDNHGNNLCGRRVNPSDLPSCAVPHDHLCGFMHTPVASCKPMCDNLCGFVLILVASCKSSWRHANTYGLTLTLVLYIPQLCPEVWDVKIQELTNLCGFIQNSVR